MDRDTAVTRIQNGLGFRSDLSSQIVLRLQEAQRRFEQGKTLPWFLISSTTLTLTAGDSSVNAPTGYIRELEKYTMFYQDSEANIVHLVKKSPIAVDEAYPARGVTTNTGAPEVYFEFSAPTHTFYFNRVADVTYTLYLNYYAAGDELTSNIENVWLANAPELLIGEAGEAMAMDLRDVDGMTLFGKMRDKAWDTVFRETIFREDMNRKSHIGEDL